MMKKNLAKSLLAVAGVAALVGGITWALFRDTEISAGNRFVAGKLNLQIDNTCHYDGMVCNENGVWEEEETGSSTYPELIGAACECTWSVKDLTDELFFNFLDVKPGDEGEDTVSIHVNNNDAWVCAEIANLVTDDNGCDSPEDQEDTTCGSGEGELQDNLFFTIWKDTNCDNKLDPAIPGYCYFPPDPSDTLSCAQLPTEDECLSPDYQNLCAWQPAVAGEQVLVDNQPASNGSWPIADSTTGDPFTGGDTVCYGISWHVPLNTGNIIQSDSLVGEVRFSAVQSRHNLDYVCPGNNTCIPEAEVCDGLDNDCDGLVDEEIAGLGGFCETGLPGVCMSGTTQCVNSELQCVQETAASEEICGDALDNDCDGFTDNRDADADGYMDTACGGDDCDDTDFSVNPEAEEILGDGIDQNCDGSDQIAT